LRRCLRIEQQAVVGVCDGAPVFHGAGGEIRNGDEVAFRQRIGHDEIVAVVGQHLRHHVEGVASFLGPPFRREHADIYTGDGLPDRWIDLAGDQRQQVGRHPRRRLRETDLLFALPGRLLVERHIRDRLEAFRYHGRHCEGRLEHRLVPTGQHAARVGRLELRGHDPPLSRRHLVEHVVDAGRLRNNLSRIVDRQSVPAGCQRLCQAEGRRLCLFVLDDRARRGAVDGDGIESYIKRVEGDRIGRLEHLDLDLRLTGECQRRRSRRGRNLGKLRREIEIDAVGDRPDMLG
jgi:hypothetical protein